MKRTWLALLLLALGCSRVAYHVGMHREDVYEHVDQLQMYAFVSELRLGQRHDVIIAPQGGVHHRIDDDLLRGGRTSFSRFRPTDTSSEEYRNWLEEFYSVRLWYALILQDLRVVAVIEDERHDRLIDRVGDWMVDNVNPEFDRTVLDEIRVREE